MFFVFSSGNPQDGEAAGGLGDLKGQFETLEEARQLAQTFHSYYDTEILDGATGEVHESEAE